MNPLLEALHKDLPDDCPRDLPLITHFDWGQEDILSRYIICMTPRSGSTWLMLMLKSTGLCATPSEFFNNDVIPTTNSYLKANSFTEYFHRVITSSKSNSTFGFEINYRRMNWFKELVDIDSVFIKPGTSFIALTRRDLLGQVISNLTAIQTGVWHRSKQDGSLMKGSTNKRSTDERLTDFNDNIIWEWLINILFAEAQWEIFFEQHNIKPLRLSYEDIVTNSRQQVLRVMHQILKERNKDHSAILAAIAKIEDATERLASETSWNACSQFTNTYANELEHIYSEMNKLDINKLIGDLHSNYNLKIKIWK